MIAQATRLAENAEKFEAAVRKAGNPRDQITRFLKCGIVLQPRQLLASAMARQCDHDDGPTEIAYGGARGGGKSHWSIAQLADDCLRHPGLKCLLLRKVGKANREGFADLRRKVLPGIPTTFNKTESTLTFQNGSTIRTGGYQNDRDIDAYLGLEYDVILIEEATTLTRSKVDDILSCLRTSKLDWRPRAYFTTNPGNRGHAWFKARFVEPWRRGEETATRFIQATIRDNRFVNRDYSTRLHGLTGWKRRAWLYGDWDIAAGQYFTTWSHDLHVLKEPIKAEYHWRIWCALDYGFVHYTAAYLFALDEEDCCYILDEHAERGALVETHVMQIKEMLARNGIAEHRIETFLAGGDVFNQRFDGRRVSEEYGRLGFPLTRANMSRRDGAAEFLRRLGNPYGRPPVQPRLYVNPACVRLIDCIPSLIHDPSQGEDTKKVDCDEDGMGGDDYYDGARYGIMHVAQSPATWGESPIDEDWRG